MSNIAHGKLGMSVRCHEDVGAMIARRMPITLSLAVIEEFLAANNYEEAT